MGSNSIVINIVLHDYSGLGGWETNAQSQITVPISGQLIPQHL